MEKYSLVLYGQQSAILTAIHNPTSAATTRAAHPTTTTTCQDIPPPIPYTFAQSHPPHRVQHPVRHATQRLCPFQ